MGNNIITSTLSNVCLQEKGSIISGPFGSNISRKFFVDFGVPVIRGNNLNTGLDNFNDHGFVFITKEKANELKCDALRGDVIFTAAGTIGQVGYVPYDSKYTRYTISNKQIRARLDTTKIDLLYAYYWLSGPWIFKLLNSNNKGSTVPLLTLSEVKNLPIHYPQDLNKQKMIGQLLDKMTQKINNNKKIISNLESLAKTIYDYWFLQFEFPNEEGKPYKSSGGKMVWNDELKREIPEGWEVKRLNCLDLTVGGTPSRSNVEYWKGEIPWLTTSEINNDVVITTKEFITELGLNCSAAKLVKENSIVMAMYGLGTAGRVAYVTFPFTTNQACCSITCDDKILKSYLYFMLKTKNSYIDSIVTGSIQKNLSKEVIGNFEYLLPNNNLLIKTGFESYLNEIIKKTEENQQLASLRDWLLPMLMNGQVTFKEDTHE